MDLSLNLLQLLTQVFSGLSGFKLVLLDCVKTSLQHLDLSVGTIRLSLGHVDALKRVLVSLSELDKPIADLLKESICFPELLIKLGTASASTLVVLCRHSAVTLWLHSGLQVEFLGDRVDQLLHFAHITAHFVDHL